ncbi:DUF1822 family protein [Okeania sp. KiyG1]|uniref:DUF1822 family protein n=1 Tax=Okeania sp. KiyG1 TaxID=2720165 RepID=UPI001923AF16|nr:DUF1822 family protein [Okeania sp. KiyG1]GGA52876.1 hypothetical protein CYANOKiyG1_72830 [Okeania sp. KiyG1]
METETLKIPITKNDHQHAKEFAAEQRSQAKKAKVYLNTLAVCAVRNFLNIVQIETDVELSGTWNPIERACFDIADLFIPHLDTSVECRPVLPEQEEVTLPPEVKEDRLGYVFVKFDNDLREAELLGFMSVFAPYDDLEDIELEEKLEPFENLFTVLERVEKAGQVDLDSVLAEVEARLKIQSRQELILKFERILRNVPDYQQIADGTTEFASYYQEQSLAAASRSEGNVNELSNEELGKLGDLAGELLEKLAEIWSEE